LSTIAVETLALFNAFKTLANSRQSTRKVGSFSQ